MYQIYDKAYLIRLLNISLFKCSESFWKRFSQIILNLYGEVPLQNIITIITSLNREGNFDPQIWKHLVSEIEKDYSSLDKMFKVLTIIFAMFLHIYHIMQIIEIDLKIFVYSLIT